MALSNKSSSSIIRRNRSFCDAAAKASLAAVRSGMDEHALSWAYFAGELCWNMHPGYYAHSPLEMALQKISSRLDFSSIQPQNDHLPARKLGARTRLHVLTVALPVGGHTRLVERMILNTAAGGAEQHSVVILEQSGVELPVWLVDAVESTGGAIVVIPQGTSFSERALRLRRLASEWADTVFLHIHPNDPVPTAAFGMYDGPPIVFVNHADHVFWLGGGAADLVSDIRIEGQQLTLSRRGGLKSALLPIPLASERSAMSREEARAHLGLGQNSTVLLAIASSYKFSPWGKLDFPLYLSAVMRRHKDVIFLVIGASESDPWWREALEISEGRLHLLGIRKELECYYAASDIFLESFPVGSLTSTLDAMLAGLPVVRAPYGIPSILAISEYDGMQEQASTLEMQVEQISCLIDNPGERLFAGEVQRNSVLSRHTGTGWHDAWLQLLSQLPSSHSPVAMNSSSCFKSAGSLDQIWSEMQMRQNAGKDDYGNMFKAYVRERFRGGSRSELFAMWRSAVLCGNWKVARVLFTDITKRSGNRRHS